MCMHADTCVMFSQTNTYTFTVTNIYPSTFLDTTLKVKPQTSFTDKEHKGFTKTLLNQVTHVQ